MKTLTNLTLAAVIAVSTVSFVHADLCGMYGVDINDRKTDDGNTLFQLFNAYFADQLGSNKFTSSNSIFNQYGVDPATDWTTNTASIVGAFKVAAAGHDLVVSAHATGNKLASLVHYGSTENIHSANGITDLTGIQKTLPNNAHLDFTLKTDAVFDFKDYTWYSDSSKNADGKNHMIALDITGLYNLKHGTDFESVFMLCWEDLPNIAEYGKTSADWDYQDFVTLVTNIKPNNPGPATTPEPATMLIIGMGLAGLGLARRNRKG